MNEEITKKISTNLGFASSALNGISGTGANHTALQANINLILSQIFEVLEEVGNEYTRVFNEYLGVKENNYIDIKYLPISFLNQSEMYNRAKELYMNASGSLKMLIASAGFDPVDYLNIMEEELEEGIYEKFTPHMTSFTASSKDSGDYGGRPQKQDSELTPSGVATKSYGHNEQR